MTRLARRRRLRVLSAGTSALLLGAGLVVAVGVAGGAPRAAANPSGAAPLVYMTGNNGNGGLVRALSLDAIQHGGAGSTGVNAVPSGAFVGPVAVNITATDALIGTSTDSGSFQVNAIDVKTGSVTGLPVQLRATPIGIAVDPVNAGLAFVLLNSGEVDQIQIGVSSPTPLVSALPIDAGDGLRVTPDSVAVSPDGGTVYIGWGDRAGFGIDAITVAPSPTVSEWFARASDFPKVADLVVAPDGQHVFAVETNGFTASSAFALTTPIHLAQPEFWVRPLQTIVGPTRLANARAVTVSPDGQKVYVGGTSGNNGSSVVISLSASHGVPSASRPVAMPTNSDGVGGLSGLSASPDGRTLLAAGVNSNTGNAEISALSLPSLQGSAATTTLPSFGSTEGPQDIAITPDQAPAAAISAASAVPVGQSITFDASASTVAFGSVGTFAWKFGDGSTQTTSSPSISHIYAAPGTYHVTLVETDSAGTSIPPGVAGTPFVVIGPGQTPYRRADPSAQTSFAVSVTGTATTTNTTTSTPTTTGSTSTTSTTTTGHGGSTTTTTTTVKGQHPAGTPTLVLNPAVGPPGTIVIVTGHGFKPSTPVTVSWSVSTGSVVITADQHGNLPPKPLLILTPDVLGPRFAEASSSPPASASFLVVPSTSEPGGDNAGLLFRSEGP